MSPDEAVDLSNCDREPIHLPKAIQPHGVLFACHGAELTVVQVSNNVGTFCGLDTGDVLGKPLADVFTPETWSRLGPVITAGSPSELNPTVVETRDGHRWEAICHRSPSGDITIVELERWRDGIEGFLPQLRASLRRMQGATSTDGVCAQAG